MARITDSACHGRKNMMLTESGQFFQKGSQREQRPREPRERYDDAREEPWSKHLYYNLLIFCNLDIVSILELDSKPGVYVFLILVVFISFLLDLG